MDLHEHAKQILFSGNLEDKLAIIDLDTSFKLTSSVEKPSNPSRSKIIQFSNKKIKFPKKHTLHENDKKAQALHFFANHELQAIELMAAGILIFPTENEADHKFKLSLMNTIQDEKKHFLLYMNRFNELGVEFGDFSVGDFFWRQLAKINTKAEFYSFLALTLEAANLDFAKYYCELFSEIGDEKTSNIMKIVYEDEIRHVAIGRSWLDLWRGNLDLWAFYIENLPELITPARAKGMVFDHEGRRKAGLDEGFINKILTYRDDFSVTDRKNWK
ncbi:hypothetical protein A9Q84_16100 [Halobacteriovorax marinus]|uniref:DUF455 domain-containing protein n=1 Tax=Halobacteriovorax marinus TaxID=97084 RepID=A0A1Y5F455_9BACT|nr:hypothetical protein A9Q84_16100 [Halobacteriovorax marinus]